MQEEDGRWMNIEGHGHLPISTYFICLQVSVTQIYIFVESRKTLSTNSNSIYYGTTYQVLTLFLVPSIHMTNKGNL